jgi:hypothetical protein
MCYGGRLKRKESVNTNDKFDKIHKLFDFVAVRLLSEPFAGLA